MGIDNKKENLTASSLFNLEIKPAIIVIPELETGMNSVTPWTMPNKIDFQ